MIFCIIVSVSNQQIYTNPRAVVGRAAKNAVICLKIPMFTTAKQLKWALLWGSGEILFMDTTVLQAMSDRYLASRKTIATLC